MREIKFKAKRKDNNEWVEGSLVYKECLRDNGLPEIYREDWVAKYAYIYEYNVENDIEDYPTKFVEVIPDTVSQYTGLKDKDGVEIYENDICKGNSYSFEEKFVIKFGKYKTDDWKEKFSSVKTCQYGWYAEYIDDKTQVHLVSPNGIEVIGNIFDDEENTNANTTD